MPTLTQIEYLLAVDTYRHFGQAAQHCFVTQPTLSMQIKKVEEELGIIIFDRSKQPVLVTQHGKVIIDQCRNVIREMTKLQEIFTSEEQNFSVNLQVGLHDSLEGTPLLKAIFYCEELYRDFTFNLWEDNRKNLLKALDQDKIDMFFAPYHDSFEQYKYQFLYEEHYVEIYSRNSSPQIISESEAIVTLDSFFEEIKKDLNIQDNQIKYKIKSIENIRIILQHTNLSTILTESFLPLFPDFYSKLQPSAKRKIVMVYNRNHHKEKLLQKIIAYFLDKKKA